MAKTRRALVHYKGPFYKEVVVSGHKNIGDTVTVKVSKDDESVKQFVIAAFLPDPESVFLPDNEEDEPKKKDKRERKSKLGGCLLRFLALIGLIVLILLAGAFGVVIVS